MFIHASCVAIGEEGVVIAGPSGIGKSDLAIRLMDSGAVLVADDQTFLFRKGDVLWAQAPEKIAGLIEARGVGVLRVPYRAAARVALYVDLVNDSAALERFPELVHHSFLDCSVRALKLPALAASTPSVIRVFMQRLGQEG